MLNYHPVDQSVSTQHQVVTATGESSLLYGNEHQLGVGVDVEEKNLVNSKSTFIKDDVSYIKANVPILKPAKFRAPEIDIGSGHISQTPGHFICNDNKKEAIIQNDTLVENNFEHLNVQFRPVAPGTENRGEFPDDIGLQEDNFQDFTHLDSRIYDKYQRGCVVLGTNLAVCSLLNAAPILGIGTHGVMFDMNLTPSFDGLFEEGVCRQYTVEKKLGSGSYGTVTLCRHANSKVYVRKVITERFKRMEVEALMQMCHPNITAFYGYLLRNNSHEILMEYGGDSLKNFMANNRRTFRDILTLDVVARLSMHGFSALAYMSDTFGILHLDVKPENVLVQFEPPTLKLTDLGTSKTTKQAVSFNGFTPEYMSPEACQLWLSKFCNAPDGWTRNLTDKTDVYAMSLTVHFMLTGTHAVSPLWPADINAIKLGQWRIQYIHHLAKNPDFPQQFAIKDEWPRDMRDLLFSGLVGAPESRMSSNEACSFICEKMLGQANVPKLVDAGLPSLSHLDVPTQSPGPALTAESLGSPHTSQDISLHSKKVVSIGKEIKLKLQRKIKHKYATPYKREISDVSIVKSTTAEDIRDERLPIFELLV